MEVKYNTNKLKKQFSNASEIKKAFGTRAKLVSQRKDEFDASPNLAVLIELPAAGCHPLTGDRLGQWAVWISGNFRIIFEIADDPLPMRTDTEIDHEKVKTIRIIEVGDYH